MRLAVPLLLLPLLLGPNGEIREVEPNDALASATPLTVQRGRFPRVLADARPTNGIVARGLLEPGDIDFYSVFARAGEEIALALQEPGRGAFHDPVLAVFGPGDAMPVAQADDGGPGFLPRLAIVADRTGTWTIAVTGFGDAALDGGIHEESFVYRLALAITSDPARVIERNDARNDDRRHPDVSFVTDVRVVPRGAAVLSGALERADVDHYLVHIPINAEFTASLFDESGGEFHDSLLRLTTRGGTLLAEDDDGGPGFLSNLVYSGGRSGRIAVLAVTGFDPNSADDRSHEEAFGYRLVLSLQRKD
jgi:hypothetical protein